MAKAYKHTDISHAISLYWDKMVDTELVLCSWDAIGDVLDARSLLWQIWQYTKNDAPFQQSESVRAIEADF